jgi:uncharacterized repeat protein (TIGR03803 family)
MPYLRPILLVVVLIAMTTSPYPLAHGQTFTVLHSFTGGQDGGGPETGLMLVGTGTLYGTTWFGGTYGGGTIFKLKRAGSGWIFQPLHQFAGDTDGCQSDGELAFGPDGAIYGTTVYGGMGGCSGDSYGTVFRIQPQPTPPPTPLTPWNETPIYSFNSISDGAYPHGNIVFDHAGNIYGTTFQGGRGLSVPCISFRSQVTAG